MKIIKSVFGIFDTKKIGSCPTCMRMSFALMVISWLVLFFTFEKNLDEKPISLALSISLTILWLTHLLVRVKMVILANSDQLNNQERRVVIGSFAKAIVGAVLLSALPPKIYADSGCGGWAGNSGCLPCTRCQRQDSNCNCYECQSCGDNCSGSC